MKQQQMDIFSSGEVESVAPKKRKTKSKRASGGKRKNHRVKKAPMLIDAYQPEEKNSNKPNKTSQVTPETEKAESKGPHIFSVSEITGDIKVLVERNFSDIWIGGEVTDFRNRTGRHFYFALKDEKNKVRAVIFNAASRRIPFELKDGLEVVCHGSLDVYGPQGYYSIIVDRIEPKGIGALQLAFEQLKKKLQAEGLFSQERKRKVPYLPRRVGVVTSPTGAAIRDIVNVMTRRFSNIEILLYPVRVQGEGAAPEIAYAIERMNAIGDLDAMIIGRGGGSIEDLWAFNEEVVARAIFSSKVPIISAVGHEIDFTISDFVADLRAPTPSAAAELVVPNRSDLVQLIEQKMKGLNQALKHGLMRRHQTLSGLTARIRDPRKRLPDLIRNLDVFRERVINAIGNSFERKRHMFLKLASNMDHLSPLGILSKGYSIVEGKKGVAIRSSKGLKTGDELKVRFHKGSAVTKVSKVID